MSFILSIRQGLAWGLAAATLALAAAPAAAVPAYARQTAKACSSCHFQHYPVLNDFGMDFKASGYVDIKNKPLAGKDLSLADSLYASIFNKIRWQKSNGKDGTDAGGVALKSTHSGELQFPDEFALLFGGRISANIGFLLEAQLASGEDATLAGYKMPMVWPLGEAGMKAAVVPFTTDGLGASYGFELLSTGAVRNVRVAEHRNETSAQQYVFFQDYGAATGVSFALYDPSYFVVVAPFTPNHLPGGGSNLGGLSATYLRAAFTPNVAGWSMGLGVQSWSGNNVRVGPPEAIETGSLKGWAIDGQAQGNVAGMPLGVYFAHASAPGSSATSTNLFNARPNARKATTLTAELGVLPQKATLIAAIRRADNGAASSSADNAITLGGTYQIQQNVQLQLNHSTRSKGAGGVGRYGPNDAATGTEGGSALTTLMLSAGF